MRRIALLLIVCVFAACAPAMGMNKQELPGQILSRPTLPARTALRSPTLLQNLNKEVTLEGFYYDGSIPMIINDMDLLREDSILPADSYVPIVGARPTGVKWGDRLSVTGTIEKPTGALARESAAIRVSSPTNFRIVTPATGRFQVGAKIDPGIIKAVIADMKAPYAVLIAGGADPANNHIRYWNDLVAMYGILTSRGYPTSHIKVIYADGNPKSNTMPVTGSATKANIAAVFNDLASRVGADNDVYIMLNDHGYQLTGGHSGLCLWGENMTDAEFAAEVNKITSWRRMMIQMKQCYSGGFVDDLTKPNRVVMSSCTANQVSWAKLTLDYGEFTYWYMSALKGSFVDGAGPVNADKNGDGKVSIMEAWNFAQHGDTAPEIPQYEDTGTAPCQSGGPMPMNGEGGFGASCGLL